jgi:hypothetical protein
MRLFFLTVLVCITAIAGTAQQKTDLEGVWKLDRAEIKQITQKGDSVTLPYIPDKYANSTDCIYPELKIQPEQVVFLYNNMTYLTSYNVSDSTLNFIFSPPMIPVKFTFEILSENKFTLWRQYDKYNAVKQEWNILFTRIVYVKD